MNDRLSESDLREIQAHFNALPDLTPLHRAESDSVVQLVDEVRRLRRLLVAAYDHVLDTPGTKELQAELEREVLKIRSESKEAAHDLVASSALW